MDLTEACYRQSKTFPREEVYGLTSQIRRSAVSIAANIAEGYGRDQTGQFIQFLRIAQGSVKELETHLMIVQRIEMASVQSLEPLFAQCERVGKMLRNLIRALETKRDAPA